MKFPPTISCLFISLLFSVQSYSKEALQLENCSKANIDQCIKTADGLYDQNKVGVAMGYYKQACELDIAHACRRVGLIYEAYDEEPELVMAMYQKSCSLGDMTGCSNIGVIYQYSHDYDKANEFFSQSCDANNQHGCYKLAEAYEYGMGFTENHKKASKLFMKSCKLGEYDACDSAANIFYYTFKDYKSSLQWYTEGCALGYGQNCYDAGYQYEEAEGVKQNMSKANEFYQESCDLNSAKGCTQIGRSYMGYDDADPQISEDYTKGLAFLKRGCDMEHALGCSGIAFAYQNGLGVEESEKQAFELYLYGCDELIDPSGSSCYNVAWIYENGSSTKRNLKLAKLYYAKACEEEFGGACESLESLE